MWETFCDGSVAVGLWERVAEARGKTHPEDAIALYKRLFRMWCGARGSNYEQALAIVKKIQALRAENKQLQIFGDELAEISLAWKRKRNFMKLLDAL